MKFIKKIFSANPLFLSLGVLFVGLVSFVGVVLADANNVSTSVTISNATPSVTTVSLNGGSSITLTEATFKWATITVTVADANGCSTISSVTAKAYLASTSNSGTVCSANDNNCYSSANFNGCTATTTGNTCAGGADTSADYDCGIRFQYIAEATDASSLWASSIWSAAATVTDNGALTGTATNSAQTVEMNTLQAIDAGPTIAYGTVAAGATSSQQTTYATTTGNVQIDVSLQGTNDMCTDYPTCAGTTQLLDTYQHYSISNGFAWFVGTALSSTSAGNVQTAMNNPSSTTTPEVQNIYWLIQPPSGQANGSYTGINVFTAITAF